MGEAFNMLPILLMFGAFYFIAIKPQLDEKKAHDALVASLTKDDRVVLLSGIHGRIRTVNEATVELDVGKGQVLTVDRASVARRVTDEDAK